MSQGREERRRRWWRTRRRMGREKQLINKQEREGRRKRRRNTGVGAKKESYTAAVLQCPSGFRCTHRITIKIMCRKEKKPSLLKG